MSRKKKQLYLSLGLLLSLLFLTFVLVYKKGGKGTNPAFEGGDFAISDTAAVDKIIITDQDRNQAILKQISEGKWSINDKYQARIENINLILYTAYSIRVKNPVAEAAKETVIRNLSVNYKKVEYYDANGNWIKTWYVGGPSKDHEGSYMVLEDENGKEEVPCLTYIPGFVGQLSSRFFCEEKSWRFTGVFNYDPNAIASVKVINYDSLVESFEIKALGEDKFELYNAFDKKVSLFDTAAVRQYLVNFKKIHFQSFNAGTLSPKQEDSLRRATPYYRIIVTDKSGKKNDFPVYHKKLPSIDDMGNPWDFEYPWDPQRAFGILESGEVVIVQFHVFDHILWPIYAFTHSKRLQNQLTP